MISSEINIDSLSALLNIDIYIKTLLCWKPLSMNTPGRVRSFMVK